MSDIVVAGKALTGARSEWAADEIRGAIEIAERHHLHKPVTEQPQYNLLERERVEQEYARLFDETGYGATIWSPLASGLLTGKYRDGIPDDSRGALRRLRLAGQAAVRRAARWPRSSGCGRSPTSSAARWPSWRWRGALTNPNVSTVITGASRPSQVVENFAAMDVIRRLDADVLARIDAAVA